MRPMNTLPAAAGFFLVLASGSYAATMSSDQTGNGCFGNWAVPSYLTPREQAWAFHPAHRPHKPHLRTSIPQGDHPVFGAVDIPWGPHGVVHHGSQELLPDLPDTDDADPEDEDGGPAAIADQDPGPSSSIPTVPEPGSLAMFGAGALGMLTARSFLRRR